MLKHYKPTTPSQRQLITLNKTILSRKPFFPKLVGGFLRSFGKNNQGKITSKARGGGHKRLYRQISFNRINVNGIVQSIEYDPNRSANIAAIKGEQKDECYYILAPEGIKLGDKIESGATAKIKLGNSLPLKNIPIGSTIHNISMEYNTKAKLSRSAGTSAQLLQKHLKGFGKVRLSSGEQRWIPLSAFATLGTVSNSDHKNINIGKAGRNRWLNKRPKVRGVAKNPVDHPHGGGEGKTSGGRPSVTPKGWITKGQPTRNKRKKKYNILN
jgi:large subunit ribosomal protein L2